MTAQPGRMRAGVKRPERPLNLKQRLALEQALDVLLGASPPTARQELVRRTVDR